MRRCGRGARWRPGGRFWGSKKNRRAGAAIERNAAVKVEGAKFRFWLAPNASVEERSEAAHVICRILIDPPRSRAERRAVAVRTALSLYEGSLSCRAKALEREYKNYLANGWGREKETETLPERATTRHKLLHRLARLGAPLSWRRFFDIAAAFPQD